jgi:GTP-binding protein Era
MVGVARESIADVDLTVLVVEPIASVGAQEEGLIEQIKSRKCPAILAINKIDTVEKDLLLEVIAAYSSTGVFDAIIPISARTKDGIEELKETVVKFLPYGPQYYPEDMITDSPERVMVAEIVREKALDLLSDEIPHGIAVDVEKMKKRINQEIVDINVTIYCEKESHKPIIIGRGGKMLKEIGSRARNDIERFLETKVFLEVWVKVREDWRNNDNELRRLHFTMDEN